MNGQGDDLGSFAVVSWSIWLDRNNLVHGRRMLSSKEVVSRANNLWGQFLACQPAVSLKITHST